MSIIIILHYIGTYRFELLAVLKQQLCGMEHFERDGTDIQILKQDGQVPHGAWNAQQLRDNEQS